MDGVRRFKRYRHVDLMSPYAFFCICQTVFTCYLNQGHNGPTAIEVGHHFWILLSFYFIFIICFKILSVFAGSCFNFFLSSSFCIFHISLSSLWFEGWRLGRKGALVFLPFTSELGHLYTESYCTNKSLRLQLGSDYFVCLTQSNHLKQA